jgi:hypothetical protein
MVRKTGQVIARGPHVWRLRVLTHIALFLSKIIILNDAFG